MRCVRNFRIIAIGTWVINVYFILLLPMLLPLSVFKRFSYNRAVVVNVVVLLPFFFFFSFKFLSGSVHFGNYFLNKTPFHYSPLPSIIQI